MSVACLPLVIIGAGILVYADGLGGPFIFDDIHSIPENANIRHLWPVWQAMSAPPQDTLAGRPVVSLSFAVNYAIHGLNVRGYHVLNVGIHLTSMLLLYGIVRRTLLGPVFSGRFDRSASWLAAACATIWMIHPLQTEAVTYIVQRTELLMGLCYLLTLYCAIRGWCSPGGWGWHAAAIGACALGMGCKEVMVSAPVMVLLYDRVFVSGSLREALRGRPRLYAGLGLTWVVLLGLNISGPRSGTAGLHVGLGSLEYLKAQAGVILWYLRLTVWPHPLVISYDDWPVRESLVRTLLRGSAVVAMLAGGVWALRRRSPLGFLAAWFFLILAPTSSVVPIVTELAAERRMYLSLAAPAVLAVVGGYTLLVRVGKRLPLSAGAASFVAGSLAVIVVATLGLRTVARNRDYRSTLAIWSDAVAKRPGNALAWGVVGEAVAAEGKYAEALRYYDESLRLKPDSAKVYSNRGVAWARLGDVARAIRDYTRAIELDPGLAEAYNNRGNAYSDMGDYSLAVAEFTRAVAIKADYAEAFNNRGVAYARTGDIEAAIGDLTHAIELRADYAAAYVNRGNVRAGRGDPSGAMADFTRAIESDPDYTDAYASRALVRGGMGDYDGAIADLTRTIQIRPGYAEAYCGRGVLHAKKGALSQAIGDLSRAIELKPDYAEAYENRGMAYCLLNEYDKARADARACTRLGKTPNPQLIRALTEATGRSE